MLSKMWSPPIIENSSCSSSHFHPSHTEPMKQITYRKQTLGFSRKHPNRVPMGPELDSLVDIVGGPPPSSQMKVVDFTRIIPYPPRIPVNPHIHRIDDENPSNIHWVESVGGFLREFRALKDTPELMQCMHIEDIKKLWYENIFYSDVQPLSWYCSSCQKPMETQIEMTTMYRNSLFYCPACMGYDPIIKLSSLRKYHMCFVPGCKMNSVSFGYSNEHATRCANHALDCMKKYMAHSCIDCGKLAKYGYREDRIPIKCRDHWDEKTMIHCNGGCIGENCTTRATYGYSKAICCIFHMKDDMEDLRSKRCIYASCKFRPSFGPKGGKPQSCFDHKDTDWINVMNKRCVVSECTHIAEWGFEGGKATHCRGCREVNMINFYRPICWAPECYNCAKFGFFGQRATSCSMHRPNHCSMYMIKYPMKKCTFGKCVNLATHGIANERLRCADHANGMPNLFTLSCGNCGASGVLKSENEMCERCDPLSFEGYKKHKEILVESFLKGRYLPFVFECNGLVTASYNICRLRPDFKCDVGSYYILLEVDEFQHRSTKDYKGMKEIDRMIKIAGHLRKPCVFVRFNPDNFRTNGTTFRANWSERSNVLDRCLREIMHTPPSCTLSSIYLFYDGWCGDYKRHEKKLIN